MCFRLGVFERRNKTKMAFWAIFALTPALYLQKSSYSENIFKGLILTFKMFSEQVLFAALALPRVARSCDSDEGIAAFPFLSYKNLFSNSSLINLCFRFAKTVFSACSESGRRRRLNSVSALSPYRR